MVQISVRFTIRSAVFEIKGCWKLVEIGKNRNAPNDHRLTLKSY